MTVLQYYFFLAPHPGSAGVGLRLVLFAAFPSSLRAFFQSTAHKSGYFSHSPRLYLSPYRLVGRLFVYLIDKPFDFLFGYGDDDEVGGGGLAARSSIEER